MLVAGVVHAKQEGGHQSQDDPEHDPLGVNTVVNVNARLRCLVGHEEKGFETLVHRMQGRQFAAL